MGNAYKILVGGVRREDYSENQSVDGRILKYILGKYSGRA
jgi:hypothetical protein